MIYLLLWWRMAHKKMNRRIRARIWGLFTVVNHFNRTILHSKGFELRFANAYNFIEICAFDDTLKATMQKEVEIQESRDMSPFKKQQTKVSVTSHSTVIPPIKYGRGYTNTKETPWPNSTGASPVRVPPGFMTPASIIDNGGLTGLHKNQVVPINELSHGYGDSDDPKEMSDEWNHPSSMEEKHKGKKRTSTPTADPPHQVDDDQNRGPNSPMQKYQRNIHGKSQVNYDTAQDQLRGGR